MGGDDGTEDAGKGFLVETCAFYLLNSNRVKKEI
jgi:hypothetical protein